MPAAGCEIGVDEIDLGDGVGVEGARLEGRIAAEIIVPEIERGEARVEIDVGLLIAEGHAKDGAAALIIQAGLDAPHVLIVAGVEHGDAGAAVEGLRRIAVHPAAVELDPAAEAAVAGEVAGGVGQDDAVARGLELRGHRVGAVVPQVDDRLAGDHRLEHRLIGQADQQEVVGRRIEDQAELDERIARRCARQAEGRAARPGRAVDDEGADEIEHRRSEEPDVEDRRSGRRAGDQHVGGGGADIGVDAEMAIAAADIGASDVQRVADRAVARLDPAAIVERLERGEDRRAVGRIDRCRYC